MACGGCGGARRQMFQGAGQMLRGNVRSGLGNMAGAARDAYRINVAKVQGTYRDQPALKATPYRRPPERTT